MTANALVLLTESYDLGLLTLNLSRLCVCLTNRRQKKWCCVHLKTLAASPSCLEFLLWEPSSMLWGSLGGFAERQAHVEWSQHPRWTRGWQLPIMWGSCLEGGSSSPKQSPQGTEIACMADPCPRHRYVIKTNGCFHFRSLSFGVVCYAAKDTQSGVQNTTSLGFCED